MCGELDMAELLLLDTNPREILYLVLISEQNLPRLLTLSVLEIARFTKKTMQDKQGSLAARGKTFSVQPDHQNSVPSEIPLDQS